MSLSSAKLVINAVFVFELHLYLSHFYFFFVEMKRTKHRVDNKGGKSAHQCATKKRDKNSPSQVNHSNPLKHCQFHISMTLGTGHCCPNNMDYFFFLGQCRYMADPKKKKKKNSSGLCQF